MFHFPLILPRAEIVIYMYGDGKMENKFETLDRLEAAEEIDIKAWMRELNSIYMSRPAKERAYNLIRIYFNSTGPSEQANSVFIAWLTNGHESEAKEGALNRFFEEIGEAEFATLKN